MSERELPEHLRKELELEREDGLAVGPETVAMITLLKKKYESIIKKRENEIRAEAFEEAARNFKDVSRLIEYLPTHPHLEWLEKKAKEARGE